MYTLIVYCAVSVVAIVGISWIMEIIDNYCSDDIITAKDLEELGRLFKEE